MATDETRSQLLVAKGANLFSEGLFQQALDAFDEAVEADDSNIAAWNNRAGCLLQLGRHQDAITSCQRALDLNPDFVQSLYLRAIALVARGGVVPRTVEALHDLDRATELDPDYADAWCKKGIVLEMLAFHHRAIQCCDKAIRLNAKHAEAWYNKGVSLAQGLQRYSDALHCFQKAKELGQPEAQQAIDMLKRTIG